MPIKKIYKYLFSKYDIHTKEVFKKSSASIIVKILGMIAGFGVSIILARTIGSEGLGIINLVNKIISIIIIFTMLGMGSVLLKEIAISYERKDYQHIADVIHTSFLFNIPIAIFFSFILIFFAKYISINIFNEYKLTYPLIIASAMIIPQIISRIFAAGVNGYRKIWQSNLVNNTLSIFIVFLGLITLLLLKIKINIINVSLIYALGRIVVTVTIGIYWKKLFKFSGKRKTETKQMLKVALPLFIVSASLLISSSTDSIMLGWLKNANHVGLYSVAARLAFLTSFFLVVTISTLTPKIASLYADNKQNELQTMVQQVTKWLFIIGILSIIFFLFAGKFILNFWGNEFTTAYWTLIILSIGQFFNISTGSTGIILMMTGHEKIIGYITFSSAIINIILNFILIPKYSIFGAAIATSFTVTIENIIKVIVVKNKTGIITIPFINISKK